MPENQLFVSQEDDHQHAIVIPMTKEAFGGFISGLLGRPQTIESSLSGAFDLDRDNIETLFHLVNQRVAQQNKGVLIQFTVAITYEDDSSVLLNSLEDFRGYREIRPQVSIGADLSWTYLIQFEDKKIPEKQVIELSINADDRVPYDPLLLAVGRRIRRLRSSFSIRIEHTARTWGADMEHLLQGQLKSWILKESWLKTWIYEHPFRVGFCISLTMTILGWWATYSITDALTASNLAQVKSAHDLSLELKVDQILTLLSDRPFDNIVSYKSFGYLGTLMVGMATMVIVGALADNPPQSFLVLSDAAKTTRIEAQRRRARGWSYFVFSGIAATAAGVLSRYIFARFFE